MSLVSQSIKLYAWKSNNVRFLAVEGEADSRMFYIQLYNTSAPIDLTNSNVKFFASKPDSTSVYCDCTIVDDIQGIVQLVLPEQMTTVSGDVDCWIQVTSADGSDLRFEGMVLEVASCGLNASAESSDDMETLREASQKVDAFTTELRNARFGEDSLGEKIEKMDRKSASNSSRIDSLVAGATEQDQNFANEVIDARTDSTGTTHSSLGEALRTTDALVRECKSDLVDQGLLLQTHSQKIDTLEADSTSLKSDIKITSDFSVMDVSDDYVKTGKFYDRTTGNFKSESKGYYTDRISCSQKDVFYITARAQYECAMIVTYDSEGGRLRTLGFNSDSSELVYEDYKFIPEANEKFVTFSSIYNTLIIKRNVGASIGTVVDKLNTNYGNDMDLVIQTTLNGDSIREDYIDGTYKITSFIGATITESLYGADGIVIKSKTTSITGNSISQSVN